MAFFQYPAPNITIAGVAQEATLQAVKTAVESIDAKTPADPATATKQDEQTVLLTSIEAKDFATETTLQSVEGHTAAIETSTAGILSAVDSLDAKTNVVDTDNVTVTASVLPTGAATEATLSSINTKTPALVGGAVPVTGPLTDTQLRAVAVPVSGPLTDTQLRAVAVPVSGAFFQATQPVSAVSLPLPTGAATEATLANVATAALQNTANTYLNSIDQKTPNLGQAAMAGSSPVVIASNQTAIPVSQQAGSVTDASGSTSATPSTSTSLIAANSARKYLIIQNLSDTATIWVNPSGTATAGAGSFKILANGSIVFEGSFICTQAFTVLSTIASVSYTAKAA